MSDPTTWTPLDMKNVELYGTCPICGAPNHIYRYEETNAEGEQEHWIGVTCALWGMDHPARLRSDRSG